MLNWLPIASAPKDGTDILVFEPGDLPVMAKWIEGEEYALWSFSDELLSDACPEGLNPTLWLPITIPK
jgi:hypothetical protein